MTNEQTESVIQNFVKLTEAFIKGICVQEQLNIILMEIQSLKKDIIGNGSKGLKQQLEDKQKVIDVVIDDLRNHIKDSGDASTLSKNRLLTIVSICVSSIVGLAVILNILFGG